MEIYKKIYNSLLKVKEKNPLIHHITNYVTVNDCANIVLAIGASPVMADDIREVEDMVSIASALVINIGTLNKKTVKSMLLAGKKANELNIPVILDPVGVGATKYRTSIALELLNEIKFSVIRGNISEIKVLSGMDASTKGVDAESWDETNPIEERIRLVKSLSEKYNAVIAITGEKDVIGFKEEIYIVENGSSIMAKITGAGCMCTSVIASYCGAEENYLQATLSGVASMGIAGEIAYKKTKNLGPNSFRTALIDSIYNLGESSFNERGKVYNA
ncbi:hydroxyethylthiazole kinase [Clostridium tetani]|uniref:Hydroxyethylthiazole kinase n=1 Tax=Clostridium tetani TaxID=1513 RepID=A0ABY0EMI3_CLOTA|nr:hydroxyethylthiazole kinase [Clostridium tetani]CDI49892.1 hydroxyethylthiazole kinase [Clostridium tetani 12124569]KHO38720.1 hydroxyethylthiazole kinase [Clostridium tetani]RXI39536.1 hydroxyethylthiazole kinase [Clostridium tetani]RXI53848.1 hydroxyethylthiazole kinase [Clostridium tetani]RXI73459.1 hydroxyethylthiazole kinase [Clostridium tetani]